MSRTDALHQYEQARKAGQKYYKEAVSAGHYPYPLVLDEIVREEDLAGHTEIGIVDIPTELIVGTQSAGRTAALAGNFMPLLDPKSEFGSKWVSLCEAHLGPEGIRDPIRCLEYLGRFYVQEGNKRVSVLRSFDAPTVTASVTRLVPRPSEDHEVRLYYEFMEFYALSGQYSITFRHLGEYSRLLAALGMEPGHIWTDWERKSFSAGFQHFSQALAACGEEHSSVTPAEALLGWLKVFTFADIKDRTLQQLTHDLRTLLPDIHAVYDGLGIEVSTEPEKADPGFFARIFGASQPAHLNIAFIYAFTPEESLWTQAHDRGRQYLQEALRDRVTVTVYHAENRDYYAALQQAVDDGHQVIFATTPSMIDACRKLAALYPQVKVFTCALAQPYTGVRTYYSRIYECKFIAGAIAGAMAQNNLIGYIANYPICGTPANINAFALGARMTNPRARIALRWSCLPGDPLRELQDLGATVISNRDASRPSSLFHALEWGTYTILENGCLSPLASPQWEWGKFYERVVLGIFDGSFAAARGDRAVNYWWGLGSGVVGIRLSPTLAPGLLSLADMLREGIVSGAIEPFRTVITDGTGVSRNDGSAVFSADELMKMDWLCANVDGEIPEFDALLPASRDTVRLLGLHPYRITPETEERQL